MQCEKQKSHHMREGLCFWVENTGVTALLPFSRPTVNRKATANAVSLFLSK